ncbi:MAG: Rieske 2Fe-2S domain-containing protein [Nocardioidaceae bacterium]
MTDEPTTPGAATESGPIPDPGLPEHLPRPTDVDPAKEKRAERQVATLFGLSSLFAILFCVAYFTFDIHDNPDTFLGLGASNVFLGLCLGLSFLAIGIGIIVWARKLMGDHEIAEERHPIASSEADRTEVVKQLLQGAEESGLARRPLVLFSLAGAMGTALLPAIVALRDLGPLPGKKLYTTIWAKGMRVVRDVSGEPIVAAELEIGELVNAEPEILFDPERYSHAPIEGVELQEMKAKVPVIVVKMDPEEITPWKGREDWAWNGVLVYSKICTHVGCPISLMEQQNHHLLCPCHQSTFDLSDNGKVVFGPAGRSLPQLPVTVDDDGYLVAQSDFTEPVGPSFWERDNTK